MKKRLILLLIGLTCAVSLLAQEHIEKRYSIFFRVNKSDIDRTYMDNSHTIQTMIDDIRTTLETDGSVPDSLIIYASTSPEGPAALNERLAIQRAEATRELLVGLFPQFSPQNIKVESRANDWSGLILVLRRDSTMVHKDAILNVLNDPRITNKDAAVRQMPEAYAEIRDGMFNYMRTASIIISVVGAPDEFMIDPELFITSESPMGFPAEGGRGRIAFDKSVADDVVPEVRCGADWIEEVVPTATGVDFVVKPNPRAETRTAPVTIECYGKTYDVVVNQESAEPVMTITSASPMNFPAEGGEGVITFVKNSDDGAVPALACDARWLSITSVDGDKTVISVAENKQEKPRSTAVTVECYGQKYDVIVNQAAAVKEPKPFYMAAKTNMLYDLAIVPNIGLEFYLGKNFSVVGNWMYSWWKSDPKAWYWRTYGGDLAFRYWFGKAAEEKPLTGHHVGLYGQIVTYDFETGGRGYLGDRWSYGGGVEYGYSLPIAKRLNIDFNLGVGYLGGEYKEYLPIDGHYVWQATKHRHWFGPTKLEISLTWLLGRGNINKSKGGKR